MRKFVIIIAAALLAGAVHATEVAAIKTPMNQMVATMKAFNVVKEKDVVTLDFVEGSTRIGMNGATKGTIASDAFNKALMRIWLGEEPVQADLKRAMLGS